ALEALRQEPLGQLGEMTEVFGSFPRGQDDGIRREAGSLQARLQHREVMPSDMLIGDYEDARLCQQRLQMAPSFRDETGTDQDIVAGGAELAPQRPVAAHSLDGRALRLGRAGEEIAKRRHAPLEGRFRWAIGAVDGYVGLGIDGIAKRNQLREPLT